MEKAKYQRWMPVLTVVLLLAALLLVRQCQNTAPAEEKTTTTQKKTPAVRGLNRAPERINYSKHARCRMACRHIDEQEVEDILRHGTINYKKSDIGDLPDCKRRYAVEGTTRDKQRVRIIFAPCKQDVTVVTVIDIGTEWPCDCK